MIVFSYSMITYDSYGFDRSAFIGWIFFFFLLAAALQNILSGVICHHSAAKKCLLGKKRLFVHIKVSKAHTLQTNAIKQDKMVNRDAVLKGFLIGYLLHSFAEDRNLIFGHTRNCHM